MATTYQWNIVLLEEDLAIRGWSPKDLSRHARVSDMTVYRFLSGQHQTVKTAKRLADAMGLSVRRYLVSRRRKAA